MEAGRADSCGRRRSRAASTARRSSSKKAGSFIAAEVGWGMKVQPRSTFVLFSGLFFRLTGAGGLFSVGFLQENLYASFGFFELLLAFAGKRDAFLEQFHGFIQPELRTFEAADHFFKTREGFLKIGLLVRLRFFRRCRVHWNKLSCCKSASSILRHVLDRKQSYINGMESRRGLQGQSMLA